MPTSKVSDLLCTSEFLETLSNKKHTNQNSITIETPTYNFAYNDRNGDLHFCFASILSKTCCGTCKIHP